MLRLHLGSRFGRQLFTLFLLAAFLPLSGLAVFAYVKVSDLLVEISDQQLQQSSKSLGMSLVEEFNWRSAVLQREVAYYTDLDRLLEVQPAGLGRIQDVTGRFSLSDDQRRLIARGKVALVLNPSGAGMLVQHPASGRLVHASIDMMAIWRNDEVPERYCVFDTAYRPLYCTPGMQPPLSQQGEARLVEQAHGLFAWRVANDHYLGKTWQARLLPAYGHPGLIMMAIESADTHQEKITQFRLAFLAIAVLAFALALLLASRQIGKQLRPLQNLLDGTRALATGNFSTRIDIAGGDEFGSLALSFNRMSETLQNKFHMLGMLSELDRAMLESSDLDQIMQSIMHHIRQAIVCDGLGIVRMDDPDAARLHFWQHSSQAPDTVQNCKDLSFILPTVASRELWYRIAVNEGFQTCVAPLQIQTMQHGLVFPVRVDGRLNSLLILLFATLPGNSDDIVDAGLALADRMAVAASSSAWKNRLYHQAHFDSMTNLPNRTLLQERVREALARADRDGSIVATLLVDMDGLKHVNDSLGHLAGDALLIECAKRLQAIARQSDTTSRLGGDEFVLLLSDLPHGHEREHLDALASTINRSLSAPIDLGGRNISLSASLGIALYPVDAKNFEELLKMADAAMYEAKQHARGSHCFYSAHLHAAAQARFELTQELRNAVKNDEFLLYYQPKVHARTGKIVGAEALIRWNSPKRGLVSPAEFLPALSEMGLDNWLGEWVLEQACAQMAVWDHEGLLPITVSVNLAPPTFQEKHLFDRITGILAQHRLPASRLEVEILETTAANQTPEIHATLLAMRQSGIHIALDDFGTGYSSLIYLTQLPANVLKLDRAFIRHLTTDARQRSIVEQIIALVRALDYSVVAEGVEEEAQRILLAQMGCDLIQGYLISRPLPVMEFARFLADHTAHPSLASVI